MNGIGLQGNVNTSIHQFPQLEIHATYAWSQERLAGGASPLQPTQASGLEPQTLGQYGAVGRNGGSARFRDFFPWPV